MAKPPPSQSAFEFILWIILVVLFVIAGMRLLGPFLGGAFGNIISTL